MTEKPINPYADWTEWDWEQAYNEFLDEIHPTVRIGDLSYDPSVVLKEVDPIAYRCGLNDYRDAQESAVEDGEFGYEDEDDDDLIAGVLYDQDGWEAEETYDEE